MSNQEDNDVLVTEKPDVSEIVTSEKDLVDKPSDSINREGSYNNKGSNNNIIITLAVVLIAVIIGAFIYFYQSDGIGGELVASVNGEKITKDDFFQEMYNYYGDDVLDDLIKRTLILQEAERKGLSVSEEEIDEEIAEIINQFGSEEEFYEVLKEYGDNIDDLRERISIDKLLQKVVMEEIDIDDEELESFFRDNSQWFDEPEEIRLKHILVDTDEEAAEVRSRLDAGDSFEELVAEFSKDDFTREEGGDLGYAMRGDLAQQFDESFEEVAFSLREGEYSIPIESYRGLHILKVTEYQEGKTADFQEVREDVKEAMISEKMGPKITEILEKLEEEADIEIYI